MLSIEVVKTRYCSSFTKPNSGNNALSPSSLLPNLFWLHNTEQYSTVLWTEQYSTRDLLWQCLCGCNVVQRQQSVEAGHCHEHQAPCAVSAAYTIHCIVDSTDIMTTQIGAVMTVQVDSVSSVYLVQLLCSQTGQGQGPSQASPAGQ